jgi:hypothetical protein
MRPPYIVDFAPSGSVWKSRGSNCLPKALIHHNFKSSPFYLSKITEVVGLRDSNISNLTKTVETNILEPLKRYGYIDSYEKLLNGKDIKYVIKRFQNVEPTTKREAGSVKQNRC